MVGKEPRFTVDKPTNDVQQAIHLRRVAYQEWDTDQNELARQHGLAAISLDPQNSSREGLETYFVVASANLRLTNYLGAAQTIQGMRDRLPSLSKTEISAHTENYLKALVPELRISRPSGSIGPFGLQILGHPGQTYELQASSDMAQWTTLQILNSSANQIELTPPDPGTSRRYYRLRWLTQP